jgi:hypothetical protein
MDPQPTPNAPTPPGAPPQVPPSEIPPQPTTQFPQQVPQPYQQPPATSFPSQPQPNLQQPSAYYPPQPTSPTGSDDKTLGILSVVFAFVIPPVGLSISLVGKSKQKKAAGASLQSKKLLKLGLIFSIITTILYTVAIVFYVVAYLASTSAGSLVGTWQCTNLAALSSTATYNDQMVFTKDGHYTWDVNKKQSSGTYKIEPSTTNQTAWESIKPIAQTYFDTTDEAPESHILDMDGKKTSAVIFNQTTGEKLMLVYSDNIFICYK